MQLVFPSLDMLDCEGRHEASCTRGSNSQSSRHIVGPAFQIQPTVQVLFSVVILGLPCFHMYCITLQIIGSTSNMLFSFSLTLPIKWC